jgi:hypothetical protein
LDGSEAGKQKPTQGELLENKGFRQTLAAWAGPFNLKADWVYVAALWSLCFWSTAEGQARIDRDNTERVIRENFEQALQDYLRQLDEYVETSRDDPQVYGLKRPEAGLMTVICVGLFVIVV